MPLLLISLDAVSCLDADRLCGLPAISSLTQSGAFCRHVHPVFPALRVPSAAAIITGCCPDAFSLIHNEPCQTDVPPPFRRHYLDADYQGTGTLWDAAHKKGLRTASVLWPASGKSASLDRNYPLLIPRTGDITALTLCRHASPRYILPTELRLGRFHKRFEQPDLDDFAVLLCEDLYSRKDPPEVLTVHLSEADSVRRKFGTNSQEAAEALERTDTRIGIILAAADKVFGSALCVCVVSACALEDVHIPFPLDMALHAACGAHAHSFGRGAYILTDDPEKARQTLESNRERWGIQEILSEDRLSALRIPGVPLAVTAVPGVNYVDGDDLYNADTGLGTDTLAWFRGPGVPMAHEIQEMHLIDVAPTLAMLQGMSLPGACGNAIAFP